jgi:hypothetical protein
MPTLAAHKLGLRKIVSGLAILKPFEELSKKWIAKKVREVVRFELGEENVSVSCDAHLDSNKTE